MTNLRVINLDTQKNVKKILYPDNQPHVIIDSNIREGDAVHVVASITSANDLIYLAELANALQGIFASKFLLTIPYLMGARSDRYMVYGDSFDLEVVANIINSCNFKYVRLIDVHSKVATSLIENSTNHIPNLLAGYDDFSEWVFIVPDKGALGRVPRGINQVVICTKERDLKNGKITLKVNEPEKCNGKICIIVDDICDGGGTFLAIAEQINPFYLVLAVTHGIFSKGLDELRRYFNKIITTNTLAHYPEDLNELDIINIDFEKGELE